MWGVLVYRRGYSYAVLMMYKSRKSAIEAMAKHREQVKGVCRIEVVKYGVAACEDPEQWPVVE